MTTLPNLRSQGWNALDTYFQDVSMQAPLTETESAELGAKACQGDIDAQHRLITSHLRLVVKIAHQYTGYGMALADLIAEGNLALIRAAELYNPRFGTKFTTYATVWVKQRLHRALTKQARAVRIPVWRSQRLRKLARISDDLSTELGRLPSEDELAQRLGLSPDDLAELNGDRLEMVPLDAPARPGEESGAELRDSFADENAVDPSEAVSRKELMDELLIGLDELEDREFEIITLKHGFHPAGQLSFRELARRSGMSHEWVRRIAELALVKVRRALDNLPKLSLRERRRRRDSVTKRLAALNTMAAPA